LQAIVQAGPAFEALIDPSSRAGRVRRSRGGQGTWAEGPFVDEGFAFA
jgi:hypothetical protein